MKSGLSLPRPGTEALSWRHPGVRAVFYQAVALLAVVAAGYAIFRNTLRNLEQRGIASGFGFLENEAGFGISEVMAIPRLEAGFLQLLAAIFGGLLGAFLLWKWAASRGKTIGGDLNLLVIFLLLVFGLPLLVFTLITIRSDTYTEASSFGFALVTGVFNTVKVSALGCVAATAIGFVLGIARLSSNWLVSRLAAVYIEVIRNIPLLLQIFFWYFAVIRSLPSVRQSTHLFDFVILNNRGVYLPEPVPEAGFQPFLWAIGIAFLAIFFLARQARILRDATGEQRHVFLPSLAVLVVLPALSWAVAGAPVSLSYPVLRGFNYEGGITMSPEYAAMLVALSMYHAAFIAEIVRSGIQSVSLGQREAALALGLRNGQVLRLVIIPQALRVMIPPLTSTFLNLTKNSSLGVAVAYPELHSVGGTILNQGGQAIEIVALTMAIYLVFSLLISVFMNWYNERVKLVER